MQLHTMTYTQTKDSAGEYYIKTTLLVPIAGSCVHKNLPPSPPESEHVYESILQLSQLPAGSNVDAYEYEAVVDALIITWH